MKKIFILALLLLPLSLCAQLTVSGISGSGGYTALRAQYYYSPEGENFALIPKFSYYQETDLDNAPQYYKAGLRGEYYMDNLTFGLEAGYVFPANGYQNYSVAGDARYFIFKDRRNEFLSTLYVGAGVGDTRHRQDAGYFSPLTGGAVMPYDLDETRVSALAGAKVASVDINTIYSKGFFSSEPPALSGVVWTDLPFFTSINRSYLDYYWNTSASMPVNGIFRVHCAYSLAKIQGADDSFQSANGGVTVSLGTISVTGNIEVMNFDSPDRRTYYALSGGLNF